MEIKNGFKWKIELSYIITKGEMEIKNCSSNNMLKIVSWTAVLLERTDRRNFISMNCNVEQNYLLFKVSGSLVHLR